MLSLHIWHEDLVKIIRYVMMQDRAIARKRERGDRRRRNTVGARK